MATERLVVELDAKTSKLDAKLDNTSKKLDTFSKTSNTANKSVAGMGRNAGMAGIQIQQFVGQIQGGQSAMVALSQQSADLGFVLGAPLLGAVAGIGASVIGMAIAFSKGGEEVKEFTFDIDEMAKSIDKINSLTVNQLKAGLIATTTQLKQIDKQSKETGETIFGLSEELNKTTKTVVTFNKVGDATITQVERTKEETKKLTEELIQQKANLDTLNKSKEDQLKIQVEINRKLEDRPSTKERLEEEEEATKRLNEADRERIKNNRELAEGRQSFADTGLLVEVIERDTVNAAKLEQEAAFIEALNEIRFTGEETLEEAFLKEVELHKAMLDAKLIDVEAFNIAQKNSVDKLNKSKIDGNKEEKKSDTSVYQNTQILTRAGMALADAAFEDNKAIQAGIIVADTAAGIMHQYTSGDPYTAFARAAAVGITGALQLSNALSASKGGGSISNSGASPSAQSDFERETSSQETSINVVGDESSTSVQDITFNTEGGSAADEYLASALNDSARRGAVTMGRPR